MFGRARHDPASHRQLHNAITFVKHIGSCILQSLRVRLTDRSTFKLTILSIFVGAFSTVGLMTWYQWSARTLTPSEIDDYMGTIEAQTQIPGARHDLVALRAFLESDDGAPVYTVNLYRFHQVAEYPEGSDLSGTGEEAYDRFAQNMVPLMVRRGSHPIFGSNWADTAHNQWDRVVIVRYRSRRDLVDLFATDAFADASMHKWASLKDHDRMLVQATHIPDGKYPIVLIAFVTTVASFALGRLAIGRT